MERHVFTAVPLDITFFLGHFEAVSKLRFQKSQVEIKTGDAPERFDVLGALSPPFGRHAVVIRFNKRTREYSLTIFPAGSGT